jgi:hypothetical protein
MSTAAPRPPVDPESNGGPVPVEGDLWESGGEFVSLSESIVVSPSPGRFRREPLREGDAISAGTVIGRVAFNGGRSLPVAAQEAGVFLGWLAWEGESLQRGTPLAHIGVNGLASDPAAARNGDRRRARRNPKSRAATKGGR